MPDIVFKIKKGTRSDESDLCPSCQNSTIIKGSRESDETRYCSDISSPIHRRVSECNSYYNKNLPSIKNLYETALILETHKNGQVGFIRYSKWKEKDGNETPYD